MKRGAWPNGVVGACQPGHGCWTPAGTGEADLGAAPGPPGSRSCSDPDSAADSGSGVHSCPKGRSLAPQSDRMRAQDAMLLAGRYFPGFRPMWTNRIAGNGGLQAEKWVTLWSLIDDRISRSRSATVLPLINSTALNSVFLTSGFSKFSTLLPNIPPFTSPSVCAHMHTPTAISTMQGESQHVGSR